MKATALHTLTLAAAALLSSCTTQYYQLHPVSGEVAQLEGRAVTKTVADSMEVVASFEREDMEYIALDVELKNRTSLPLNVDPSNFRMTLLDANRQPLAQPGTVDFKQAADPDYEAGRMGYKVKQEEARLKRNKVLNTVLMVALVATDIASHTSSRRSNSEWRSFVNTQNNLAGAYTLLQAKRIIDHASFANKMQRFQFEEYRWRELAMKRTEVKPGESVRGFVYLPKAKGATYLNITYPTASGELALLFEQNVTTVRPN
jgi:hypothetical protein